MKNCFNEYDDTLLLRTVPQGRSRPAAGGSGFTSYRARGVACTPEQIVIGAGTDNLLLILGYILPNSFMLAVENPPYNHAHGLFSRLGHPVTAVPVDPDGIRLSALPSRDQVVVYATPLPSVSPWAMPCPSASGRHCFAGAALDGSVIL